MKNVTEQTPVIRLNYNYRVNKFVLFWQSSLAQ